MFKSPNDDNGYDISDYQEIMDEFGTMEDFDRLLKGVHDRGMKLILDLVVNHTSDEHPWFIESKSSKDNPKRDWYIWQDQSQMALNQTTGKVSLMDLHGNMMLILSNIISIYSVKQPDLNWDNPEVRDAVFEMMNWWFDKGIDGFRVDAITHIKRRLKRVTYLYLRVKHMPQHLM